MVSSFWQDGVVFREQWLAEGTAALELPRWWTSPDPDLDPYESVTIDPDEIARRAAAKAEEEARMRKERERLDAAMAKERERRERRELKEERKRRQLARKQGIDPDAETAVADASTEDDKPPEWVDLSFDQEKDGLAQLDSLEVGQADTTCADLQRLEPRALIGRLTEEQILCLELRLRREERMTTKNKLSRVVMADSWAKQDLDRWQAAVRRHLQEIDRSDADLCYLFARWLAHRGGNDIPEAIRWANAALANSLQWEGEVRVQRMYSLHRINAIAAQTLWLDAEADALKDPGSDNSRRANFWRNQTKSLAREWLSFSRAAELDPAASFELCTSAAGTRDYCNVQ